MIVKLKIFVVIISLFQTLNFSCNSNFENKEENDGKEDSEIKEIVSKFEEVIVGAERIGEYWSKIKDKNLAMVVNQTSMFGEEHLVDVLLEKGAKIKTIFAPEHGFRGKADAGEKIKDGIDAKTGLKIQSLYGENKKPRADQLKDIDLVIFDIQDVGARFYTYISTMSYVMEACAENGVAMLILDRPNPNGHYVDGPVLEEKYSSFIGLHQIPVVHGMTIGEYAKMVNREGWLKNGIQCILEVILCEHYTHDRFYQLPIKPSPNLPNERAIFLYPSLCFFEGTNVSVGRGTNKQFQIYGSPDLKNGNFEFVPKPMDGAKYPKHEDKLCLGFDLGEIPIEELKANNKLNINYLLSAYADFNNQENFFLKNNFFDKLVGNNSLKQQIVERKAEKEIRESWEPALSKFKKMRGKYLLYE